MFNILRELILTYIMVILWVKSSFGQASSKCELSGKDCPLICFKGHLCGMVVVSRSTCWESFPPAVEPGAGWELSAVSPFHVISAMKVTPGALLLYIFLTGI